MKALAVASLLAMAACSDAKSIPPKSGRFTCETHMLNQFQIVYLVTDTTTGREFILTNRGGIMEAPK